MLSLWSLKVSTKRLNNHSAFRFFMRSENINFETSNMRPTAVTSGSDRVRTFAPSRHDVEIFLHKISQLFFECLLPPRGKGGAIWTTGRHWTVSWPSTLSFYNTFDTPSQHWYYMVFAFICCFWNWWIGLFVPEIITPIVLVDKKMNVWSIINPNQVTTCRSALRKWYYENHQNRPPPLR